MLFRTDENRLSFYECLVATFRTLELRLMRLYIDDNEVLQTLPPLYEGVLALYRHMWHTTDIRFSSY